MAEELDVVLKIEIDQGAALQALEDSEEAMLGLKNQQKELNDALKEGTITDKEYAAQKVQLDQRIRSENENRKTLTKTIETESNSLNAQKQRLAELIKERNNIDRSTVEGKAKFDQMNKSILGLNSSIKKAEEQGGSFQRNVGNYKGTIDQFTGGAFSAAEGLSKMTVQALRFIATPIGAIIAAIALAIGALTAYFRGSEEGQNRWNKIVKVGEAVLESFMNIVEDFGEIVFDAFSVAVEWVGKFADMLGIVPEGIDAALTEAIQAGEDLADMQANLAAQERIFLVENAEKRLEISRLRRSADEAEGKNKLNYLNQALALEKQVIDTEVANAVLRRDIAKANVEMGNDDKEGLKALAEAEAAVFAAKQMQFDETRKMNKERIATEKEIDDAVLKRIDNEAALARQEADRAAKAEALMEKELTQSLANIEKKEDEQQKSLMVTIEGLDEELDAERAASDADYENYKANEEKKRLEAQKTRAAVIAAVMATGDVTMDILNKVSIVRAQEAANQIDIVKIQQGKELALLQEKLDKGEISEEEFKKEKARIERESLTQIDDIKRKAFEADKKNRIAEAIIDAIQSGIAAFKALAGIPIVGPILAAAASAAAVAFGYKQVDLIRDQKYVPGSFAEGGFTGFGAKNEVAGQVHRGEYVVPAHLVANPAYAGYIGTLENARLRGYQDGGLVKNLATSQIDQNIAIANALRNLPPIFASWTEAKNLDAQIQAKMDVVEV